nr:hypothetical protein [Nitrosomonas nitrosa]
MSKAKPRWRPSPLLVTGATASFIILLVVSLNWLAVRRNRLTARVEIAPPIVEAANDKTTATPSAPRLPDGEVERTALRVREASALVVGLTLFAVNEGLQRRPLLRVEALTAQFVTAGLLPPGIAQDNNGGVLASPHANIYVRYRPSPLAVEVVSLGREDRDGPALIARIVTGAEETSGASLLLARQLGNIPIPDPFTPNAQMTALNWSIEPLRERSFTAPELAQLNAWLQAQTAR